MDSHTAFYFPPACKDRAVSSMEIKDFIILWKKCNILPSFLLIHIVDSTFHHPTPGGWSPSLSREENVLRAFINQLLHSCPLQEENLPLHSCNLQVLHNSMNLGSYRPANKVRRFSIFPCNSKMPHFKLVACKKAAP